MPTSEPQKIRQSVYVDKYSIIEGTFKQVITYLQQIAEDNNSTLDQISLDYDYYSEDFDINAYINRLETPEEVAVRVDREEKAEARLLEIKMKQFENLKKELGL